MSNRFHNSKSDETPGTGLPEKQAMRLFADKNPKSRQSTRKRKYLLFPLFILLCLVFSIAIFGILLIVNTGAQTEELEIQAKSQSIADDYFDSIELETNSGESAAVASVQLARYEPGDDLRTILARHAEAMGGMQNWQNVESIRLRGTLERDGQIVDICIVKKRPNRVRATVTLPIPGSDEKELQVIRAHDGKTGWTATRLAGASDMHKEELPPEAAQTLLDDSSVLPPLIRLWQDGTNLKLLGTGEINNIPCLHIEAIEPESPLRNTFHISTDTYRLIGYDTYKSDVLQSSTRYQDFTAESGVILPIRNVIESPETGASVMTTKSVKIGVGIFQEYFDLNQAAETAQAGQ